MSAGLSRLKLLPPRGAVDPADPAPPPTARPRLAAPAAPPKTPERRVGRPRLPGLPRPPRVRLPRAPRPRLPNPATWTRYTLGLAGLLILGLLVRLPLLWAAPLDTPSAPQATMAAFVRRLAATGGDLKAALPWIGPLPIDLTGGLPLYAWVAALFSGFLGPQAWIGRALALAGALAATGLLFVVVRRLAGGRAALYAALFLTVTPPGLYYGRAYLPETWGWAAGCAALAAALRWRDCVLAGRPDERRWFRIAAASGGLALLLSSANLALLPPLLYLARSLGPLPATDSLALDMARARRAGTEVYLYAALLVGPLLLWWALTHIGGVVSEVDPAFGGGGIGAALAELRRGEFYGLLAGRLVNGTLTVAGFLLLLAGLGRPARAPWPWVLHLWAGAGLVVVLGSAARLAADDSTLVAWLPALAAVAGLGANWVAALPAAIVAALRGHEEEAEILEADLDDGAPADEPAPGTWLGARRPARGAVRRAVWSQSTGARPEQSWPRTRTALLRLGNAVAVILLLAVFAGGFGALTARYEVSAAAKLYEVVGSRAAATGPGHTGGRMVVAGPGAPEMFYTAGLTGWAVPQDRFSRAALDQMKQAGAVLLISADQTWLGRQPDYPGLVASFQVALLAQEYIIFDLHNPPPTRDSLYFLETGHTLRGSFRAFWQNNGGVARFGFPLTEELQEVSPEDGKERTVQYFERAVMELHPDQAGTPYDVQLAPLGRRLLDAQIKRADALGTQVVGVDPVPEAPNTPTYHFFKETGHSVKGEFLKTWQAGGVRVYGYPISEEMREISPADGKVHIVQYFERARFEWHQEFAGTPNQVQLGLIGREWLEAQKR
jgi:hypothetical protein